MAAYEEESRPAQVPLFLNLNSYYCAAVSNKDLPVKKNTKKRKYNKIKTATNNKNGTSIAQRPEHIETRDEYGHWELDTVVGKKGTKTVLLILTERKLGSKFFNKFKTITCDNGCENLDFEGMERSIINNKKRTTVYYAHPYLAFIIILEKFLMAHHHI